MGIQIQKGQGVKTVGTSEVFLSTDTAALEYGVTIKASPDNADTVLVGSTETDAADWWPLEPGEAGDFFFPQASAVRLVSGTAAQTVHWRSV